MKKLIPLLLLAVCMKSQAQTAAANSGNAYSLEQAIEYAYKNSPSVLNANLDIENSVYKKKELLGAGFPQIAASVDVKDYISIPTSLIPAQFFGGPAGTFLPVKFGTKYNTTAGFSASQLVFSSDYIIGVKAAKELINLSTITVTRTKSDLAAQVSKAYYSVLVSVERAKLLEANLAKLDKLFSDNKAMSEQGLIEKIDVDRIEVTLNNLKSEKEKVDRLIELSKLLLKFQMGYKGSDDITLSDQLNAEVAPQNLEAKADVSKRSEFQLLETQRKLLGYDVKRQKWGYLPTLAAYGSLNYNAQRQEFDFFDGSKPWFNISLVGATLNLNVFDGLQRNYRVQQAKVAVLKAENNINQFKMSAELEAASAAISYNNALTSMVAQKRNLDLAQNVVDVTKKKFDAGVGSNLELVNAQTSLKEAETNYYGSVYDLLVAKTDYLKATGALVK
ncbi:MAG: TolC family protein [Bacteroidia bacterium]